MQLHLFEKKMVAFGENVKLIEWAERYYSIQVEQKIYPSFARKIKPSENIFEHYIDKRKTMFYQDEATRNMELLIATTSELYSYIVKNISK